MNAFDPVPYFANLWVFSVLLLPLYHFVKSTRGRETILLLFGAALIFHIAPRLIPLYAIFWLVVFLSHRLVLYTRMHRLSSAALALAVGLTLAPMVLWKWNPESFQPWLMLFGQGILERTFPDIAFLDSHRGLLVPIGLSVATFRGLDLIIQTYLESVQRQSPLRVMAYGFCPFLIPVGPITLYQEFKPEAAISRMDLLYGSFRILIGLTNIYLLAALLEPWSGIFRSFDRPGWQIIVAIYVFAFYFYFNFAGYSDLAIGSGRLFGQKLPENFRRPLTHSDNPQAFWGRWHASLSRFAQRYVFSSLGGVRPNRRPFALFCTIMVIALWHEFSWSYVLYGLYHGTALVGHSYWSQHRPAWFEARRFSPLYKGLSRFAVCSLVAFGFPIIMLPVSELPDFYLRIFRW